VNAYRVSALAAVQLAYPFVAIAQSQPMMGGGMNGFGWMGGYGGFWLSALVCIAVVALIVWFIARRSK
jgi:uncharacterized membrane protein